MGHDHHHPVSVTWIGVEITVAIVLVAAALAYGLSAWRIRGSWPLWRTILWLTGLVCIAAGMIGPWARAATTGFTEHMLVHLLIGMSGPLLLVLAAPIALALRVLPTTPARLLTGVLGSGPVQVLTHPVTAMVLNAGGLWVLYTTPLFHLMHSSLTVHVLVHLHVIIAGVVFTAAMISPDPQPHRASFRVRVGVMVVFIAAHSVLGKWLYAYPPAGVEAQDARIGAQLMYYGGDVVDVVILVLLFAGWYSSGPRPPLLRPNASRTRNPRGISPSPGR